jgi:hypothetical protein
MLKPSGGTSWKMCGSEFLELLGNDPLAIATDLHAVKSSPKAQALAGGGERGGRGFPYRVRTESTKIS